eukprot:TRINITY_DN6177_c0_g1_i4.p1 TRINITY_DN6177_c0_g1~~TRINITY_DN6177_c0_g1_i4.p1  ORF type:complete len:429 (+),score=22.62 TRINITY_DN6177_c0_g1_i4:120-1289(+)
MREIGRNCVKPKTNATQFYSEGLVSDPEWMQLTRNMTAEPSFEGEGEHVHDLKAWGSDSSGRLYVFSVGKGAKCRQYADTLFAVATQGYYVLCPEISHSFSLDEWVMKAVHAVEWARRHKRFDEIVLGGHSGGAAVSLAAGHYLRKHHGVDARGFVMQHPGVVKGLNVPGCERDARTVQAAEDCRRFFPDDLVADAAGKILITCGTFCEDTAAQDSNWFHKYACVARDHACNRTFPTPLGRPGQAPIECRPGTCPNHDWLEHPGDCMVEASCSLAWDTYLHPVHKKQPPGGGLLYRHCGEHEFSVFEHYGLLSEGFPVVLPFLRYLKSGRRSALASIMASDGEEQTCYMEDRRKPHIRLGLKGVLPSNTSTASWLQTTGKVSVTTTRNF